MPPPLEASFMIDKLPNIGDKVQLLCERKEALSLFRFFVVGLRTGGSTPPLVPKSNATL